MSAAMFGYLVGSFAMSLLFAAIWLIICKLVPALRTNIKASYSVAIGLAFVPALLTVGVSDSLAIDILGAFLCANLLFWQFKRAQLKSGN